MIRSAYKKSSGEKNDVSTGARQIEYGKKIILCYGGGQGGFYQPIAILTVAKQDTLDPISDMPGFGVINDKNLSKLCLNYGYEPDPFLNQITAIGVKFDRILTGYSPIKRSNTNAICRFADIRKFNQMK